MGKVRDFIAMLTLNIAKYENGSMDKLEQSFNRLMDFRDFKSVFNGMSIDNLKQMIQNENETDFSKYFTDAVKRGLKGEGGWKQKQRSRVYFNHFCLTKAFICLLIILWFLLI